MMYRPRRRAYTVPGFWHNVIQGRQYPSGAPVPADVPPWGIHTEDPREAHHGAALADDMAAGAALAGFHNILDFRTVPPAPDDDPKGIMYPNSRSRMSGDAHVIAASGTGWTVKPWPCAEIYIQVKEQPMHREFRNALNLAARVVEEEAIMFDEEAAEIKPSKDETVDTKEDWERYDQTRGRVHSLRKLATAIRSIKG